MWQFINESVSNNMNYKLGVFFTALSLLLPINLIAEPRLLQAVLAADKDTKPSSSFAPDVPKLYAFYTSSTLKAREKVRAVWIAEDVGEAAPKDTKIDEATLFSNSASEEGAFSLSRPEKGWPLGTYRVELFVGEILAETLKFKIENQTK